MTLYSKKLHQEVYRSSNLNLFFWLVTHKIKWNLFYTYSMHNFCSLYYSLHLKRNQCNNRNKEQKKKFFLKIYNIIISYTTTIDNSKFHITFCKQPISILPLSTVVSRIFFFRSYMCVSKLIYVTFVHENQFSRFILDT